MSDDAIDAFADALRAGEFGERAYARALRAESPSVASIARLAATHSELWRRDPAYSERRSCSSDLGSNRVADFAVRVLAQHARSPDWDDPTVATECVATAGVDGIDPRPIARLPSDALLGFVLRLSRALTAEPHRDRNAPLDDTSKFVEAARARFYFLVKYLQPDDECGIAAPDRAATGAANRRVSKLGASDLRDDRSKPAPPPSAFSFEPTPEASSSFAYDCVAVFADLDEYLRDATGEFSRYDELEREDLEPFRTAAVETTETSLGEGYVAERRSLEVRLRATNAEKRAYRRFAPENPRPKDWSAVAVWNGDALERMPFTFVDAWSADVKMGRSKLDLATDAALYFLAPEAARAFEARRDERIDAASGPRIARFGNSYFVVEAWGRYVPKLKCDSFAHAFFAARRAMGRDRKTLAVLDPKRPDEPPRDVRVDGLDEYAFALDGRDERRTRVVSPLYVPVLLDDGAWRDRDESDWLERARELELILKEERDERVRRSRHPTTLERLLETSENVKVTKAFDVMTRLFAAAAKFDDEERNRVRYPPQINIMRRMLAGTARFVFGADFALQQANILKKFGLRRIDKVVAARAARRFGKSKTFGMVGASVIACVPNFRLHVMAHSASATKTTGVFGAIKRELEFLGVPLDADNASYFSYSPTPGDRRTATAAVATMSALGSTADGLMIDEPGAIDNEIYEHVIAPIAKPTNTAVWAMGSPAKDPRSWFQHLLDTTGDAAVIVETVCPSCRAAGKTKFICVHRRADAPDHVSELAERTNVGLYAEGNDEVYEREMMGNPPTRTPQAFDAHALAALFSNPRRSIDDSFDGHGSKYIIVAVDPCGGTAYLEKRVSEWSMTTMAVHRGRYVVVGLEAFPVTTSADYAPIMIEHLRRLREFKCFADALFVVGCEQGTGQEHGNVVRLVQEAFLKVYPVRNAGKDGLSNGAAIKETMVELMVGHLRDETLAIAADLVSVKQPRDAAIQKLRSQLGNYERIVEQPKTPFGKTRSTWSGKGRNNARVDDACVSFLLCLAAKASFLADPARRALYGV